jgi:putative transposase
VASMLRNHHVAQALGDVGFHELKRQLTYKAAWHGSRVVLADRWEPSSKTRSGCGWMDADLALADRTFRCRNPRVACGLVLDRDLNAALNLSKFAKLTGGSSHNANACGATSAGLGPAARVTLASPRQEPDAGHPLVA